jgi:CheY-like chemotaxis protein
MDGYEATRLIRNHGITEVPLIVLSADVTQNSIRKAKVRGADDYLLKPVNPDQLVETLSRHLGIRVTPEPAPKAAREKRSDSYESFDMAQALDIVDGDAADLCRLLSKLLVMIKKHYGILIEQADREDIEGVKATAHLIKGSAANLGVVQVARVAKEMEEATKSGRFGSVQEAIIAMSRALNTFEKELAALCGGQDTKTKCTAKLPDFDAVLAKIKACDAGAKEDLERIIASMSANEPGAEHFARAVQALEAYDFNEAETIITTIKEKI